MGIAMAMVILMAIKMVRDKVMIMMVMNVMMIKMIVILMMI